MTALEIVKKSISDPAEALFYTRLAEEQAREYLNYNDNEPVAKFSTTIAAAAILLYNKAQSTAAARLEAAKNAGLKGESYSEAGVSRSVTYMAGADYTAEMAGYDDVINKTLEAGLKRFRRLHVIGGGKDGINAG